MGASQKENTKSRSRDTGHSASISNLATAQLPYHVRNLREVCVTRGTSDTSAKSRSISMARASSGEISPPPSKCIRLSSSAEGPEHHPDHSITIYSWNVNGIAPFIQRPITAFFQSGNTLEKGSSKQGADPVKKAAHAAQLRGFLRRHGWPTVLFLQEVKINPDDAATIAAVEKAVRWPHDEDNKTPNYAAHFCLPSDKHNARGFGRKVYGVCSILREDFFERHVESVRPVSWDQEGRFQIIETKAVDDVPKLAFINVYAVNGTDNPYKDPETGEPRGTRYDRKLKVHSLLQAECRRLEAEGFSCIVAGDINIARSVIDGHPNLRTFPKQHCVNRADFETRFISDGPERSTAESPDPKEEDGRGLGMVDTFRHLHPDKRGYTYYPRTKDFGVSCDRVDMILISKELEPSLKEAGMHETSGERGPSDHVPLFARFDFGKASLEPDAKEGGVP